MPAGSAESFDTLPIPRKGLDVAAVGYRVYTDAGNFVSVQAQTAQEAMQASGLPEAYKIERESLGANKILGPKALKENAKEPASEPVPAAEAAAAPVNAAPTETPQAAAEPALSKDEVDNLLKN